MRKFKSWSNIYPIVLIYLTSIAIFFLFRCILFFLETDRINGAAISDICYSFFIGLRFDIAIIGYVLVIPYLVLTFFFLTGKANRIILKIISHLLTPQKSF